MKQTPPKKQTKTEHHHFIELIEIIVRINKKWLAIYVNEFVPLLAKNWF